MTRPTGRKAGRPKLAFDALRQPREVRLSDREWADVRASAKAAGLRLGPYCRRVLAGRHVRPAPSVADQAAWAELARVHSNLNQVAHALNLARKKGVIEAEPFVELRALLLRVEAQTAALRHEILGIPDEIGDDEAEP